MKTAFAICAHPDDIEFLMSGTMMRLADAGYKLHYMNVANGCCGSTVHSAEETARVRLAESQAAAEFVGAIFHLPFAVEEFFHLLRDASNGVVRGGEFRRHGTLYSYQEERLRCVLTG